MSEQSAIVEATSIPEAVVMEASRGPLVNLTVEQRKEFRTTGTLPKAESAPATSVSGESEAPKQQEKPKSEPKSMTAAERIAQIEAKMAKDAETIEKIRTGAGLKPKAEPTAPAKSEPVSAKPTPEDKNKDGTDRFATHEEYVEALVDWKSEQRDIAKAEKAQQDASNKALNDKVDEGRTRYENLDEVIQPAANEIYQDADISPVIKQMIGDSDVIVDLVYTIGSDKAELAKFIKMAKSDPGKAIRYIALTESLIAQELEAKATPAKEEETPAKPRTLAPKPPAEAGGRASAPPDPLQAALAGSGGKLTGDLKAEFTRQALARMK